MAGDRSLNNAILIYKKYCNFIANDNTHKRYMMLLGAVKKIACTSNVTKLDMMMMIFYSCLVTLLSICNVL